ncbi:MAG: hypothetical protein CM15mV10_3130 [uncultured marine virus]|nr:MAG: hypothetical protein CM15mV10_3130 [uncultured marine virus]
MTLPNKKSLLQKVQEIQIGDYVRYYKEYGQIILRFDDTEQVYLTNDKHLYASINWKKLKSLLNFKMTQLEFLTEVLSDYCYNEQLPFMSASDILVTYKATLSVSQREWLRNYIIVWDIIQENDSIVDMPARFLV